MASTIFPPASNPAPSRSRGMSTGMPPLGATLASKSRPRDRRPRSRSRGVLALQDTDRPESPFRTLGAALPRRSRPFRAGQLILRREEQKNARLPVVVGRHLIIEPQHLRPATQKRRTIEKTREVCIQDGPDDLVIENPGSGRTRERRPSCGNLLGTTSESTIIFADREAPVRRVIPSPICQVYSQCRSIRICRRSAWSYAGRLPIAALPAGVTT